MKTSVIAKRGLVALLVSASAVAAAPRLAGADTGGRVVTANAPLTDLSPATTDPTDGASAHLVAVEFAGQGTRALLIVTGMRADAVGSTFGAHVHTGTCVAGQPAIAGPHYRVGESPSPQTEVWLDFTVLPGGVGIGRTSLPFTIAEGGANSVVIHRLPTDPNGAAGPRIACIPVAF